ncbi:iron-sulfur protein [Streptomyces acidiscabies]|uniref:Iron-sulfur protein n=2 Tax=Streptomyces acidiscabies TaxID=42234 RepID=A0A0L0K7P7_9ACTN|nr:(2Fe-2S)-binding protein [Streptomyces acidiscabies]KND33896.1 iron-sulfur protein [Streptomyces acidiscabies]
MIFLAIFTRYIAVGNTPELETLSRVEHPMPVTDVLHRVTALCDVLDVRVTAEEPLGTDLLTDTAAFVDAEADRIRERYDVTVPRHVAASRALHDYAWSAALLMSGPWFLERRVPLIRPQDIRADLATASYQVRPTEALADDLLDALTAHMEPVLDAFAPLTRRGSRALWGMVGDDLVSGLWYLGRVLDREDDGIRAASEILPGPVGRFPAGAAFRNLTAPDGSCHPTRTRAGCCMFYAVRPTEACGTCPRTSDAERLRRLG